MGEHSPKRAADSGLNQGCFTCYLVESPPANVHQKAEADNSPQQRRISMLDMTDDRKLFEAVRLVRDARRLSALALEAG